MICSSVALRELFSFPFVLINYFNWRILLYNIVMIFAIHQHEPATGIHVSSRPEPPHLPPSPLYPSGLSQSTGFGCPASCIELALVIPFTYGYIHISMLFSQIISPLSSPTESKSLFFTSVSLAALHVGSSLSSF